MTEAFAVVVLFATPSPNIPRPITTPSTGPGNAMTAKNPVATRADTVNMMPLTASNPPTRYDLCFHDTTNAPIASTRALMGTTGTNHAGPAPGTSPICAASTASDGCSTNILPAKKGRTAMSDAAASPTDNMCFEFVVMAQSLVGSILTIVDP